MQKGIRLLLCFALLGATLELGAQTNINDDLLSNPQLFADLVRTNHAMLEAIVNKHKRNYDQAVRSGSNNIPYVREFNQLFTNHTEGISYYTAQVGPSAWYSKAGLFERYHLLMHMKIKIDAGTNIVSHEPPEFILMEVPSSWLAPKGPLLKTPEPEPVFKRFDAAQWKQLVQSKGDLSVLGIQVKTNNPVPGFKEGWKSL
ncbi:MAG: hypothetical protein JWQ71_2617 [Pedosphaera sp.]|nr:hypothetical protein [Pedosphaera sp.]